MRGIDQGQRIPWTEWKVIAKTAARRLIKQEE